MPTVKCPIRKNDNVLVLTGKDRGKTGRVLRILPKKGKAVVENVNFIKRHTRANPARGIKGGVLEKEAPVQIGNLLVVCQECSKPTRTGHRRLENGKNVRTCKRCGGVIDKL
jgi:large subunit ribosomal protein L24